MEVVFLAILKSQGFSLSKFHWPSDLAVSLPFLVFIIQFVINFKKIEIEGAEREVFEDTS